MRVLARSNGLILDVADEATIAHVPTAVADTNNTTCCGDEPAGNLANDRVVAAAGEAKASTFTYGHIEAAGGVARHRTRTDGRVVGADGVGKKGERSIGRVAAASGAQKCPGASRRVSVCGGAAEQRPSTDAR